MILRAEWEPLEVTVPEIACENEESMKAWLWENRKEALLANMSLKPTEQIDTPPSIPTEKRLQLLDALSQVQHRFMRSEDSKVIFGCLLEQLLPLMDSEYGFIGELKHEEDGTEYLQTHAITNIAWNAATEKFYEDNINRGLKFTNLDSLFGEVVTSKHPVIANDPKNDSRACGIPEGHPSLDFFLGIPFFNQKGEMTGMVGIANKPGGYSETDIRFLEPFTATCSNLIQAYWQVYENQRLINSLEDKVKERTQRLVQANQSLEEAHTKAVKASAMQLRHFACMSHEIRTPLNCIIGLSSLIIESNLPPMQKESMQMIVHSGDLLLAVVNDVLDYSKLETGNVDIVMQRNSLQEVLSSVVRSMEMKAQKKRLRLKTNYDFSLPEHVTTDRCRLQQILYNLLGNAIKFSKEDASIELSVSLCKRGLRSCTKRPKTAANDTDSKQKVRRKESQSPNGESVVSLPLPPDDSPRCPFSRSRSPSPTADGDSDLADQTEDSLRICPVVESHSRDSTLDPCPDDLISCQNDTVLHFVVKDYGKGINKKDFARIFKPFLQADAETEYFYGGTGLGLSISSKIVKALGGTIGVGSVEGEWTEFTVDLPFQDEPADVTGISACLKKATIVVVDECQEEIEVVSKILKDYDVDFLTCKSLDQVQTMASHVRSCLCLVQEDLYDEAEFENFRKSVPSCTMVTFGPKHSVPGQKYIRSIVHVLPSVLMSSLCTYVKGNLKASTAKPARKETSDTPEDTSLKKLRILVAEDNIINQKVLLRMLKRLGIDEVDVVDNGQKAVDKEAQIEYDVVLMDAQMPVMDGLEACKLIMSREGGHKLPLVAFVTAQVSYGFESDCMKAGASSFLAKPFNVQEINACLLDLARRSWP